MSRDRSMTYADDPDGPLAQPLVAPSAKHAGLSEKSFEFGFAQFQQIVKEVGGRNTVLQHEEASHETHPELYQCVVMNWVVPPVWAPESDRVYGCVGCEQPFKKARIGPNTHHTCRLCGQLFCNKCTLKRVLPRVYNRKGKIGPTRVCKWCDHAVHKKVRRLLANSDFYNYVEDKMKPPESWASPNVQKMCASCGDNLKRNKRHNCRLCGVLFCSDENCSAKALLPMTFNKKGKIGETRVCVNCKLACRDHARLYAKSSDVGLATRADAYSRSGEGGSGSVGSSASSLGGPPPPPNGGGGGGGGAAPPPPPPMSPRTQIRNKIQVAESAGDYETVASLYDELAERETSGAPADLASLERLNEGLTREIALAQSASDVRLLPNLYREKARVEKEIQAEKARLAPPPAPGAGAPGPPPPPTLRGAPPEFSAGGPPSGPPGGPPGPPGAPPGPPPGPPPPMMPPGAPSGGPPPFSGLGSGSYSAGPAMPSSAAAIPPPLKPQAPPPPPPADPNGPDPAWPGFKLHIAEYPHETLEVDGSQPGNALIPSVLIGLELALFARRPKRGLQARSSGSSHPRGSATRHGSRIGGGLGTSTYGRVKSKRAEALFNATDVDENLLRECWEAIAPACASSGPSARASLSEREEMRAALRTTGGFDSESVTPELVAELVKKWLAELPEPLFFVLDLADEPAVTAEQDEITKPDSQVMNELLHRWRSEQPLATAVFVWLLNLSHKITQKVSRFKTYTNKIVGGLAPVLFPVSGQDVEDPEAERETVAEFFKNCLLWWESRSLLGELPGMDLDDDEYD